MDPLGSLLSGSYLWFLRAFSRLLSWKHLLLLHLLLLHLLLRLPRNAKRLRMSAALGTKVEVTMMHPTSRCHVTLQRAVPAVCDVACV